MGSNFTFPIKQYHDQNAEKNVATFSNKEGVPGGEFYAKFYSIQSVKTIDPGDYRCNLRSGLT